jgi:hypothetical protein
MHLRREFLSFAGEARALSLSGDNEILQAERIFCDVRLALRGAALDRP